MRVTVPRKYEKFVADRVKSGSNATAEGVVTEALMLLKQREARRRAELAELKAKIQEGIDALDRGDYVDLDSRGLKRFMDEIKRDGRRRLSARIKRAA